MSRRNPFAKSRRGKFVIVGFGAARYHTLQQARFSLYGAFGPANQIAHVVEDYQKLEGAARPFEETSRTRVRRLVNSKLDPLYASRKLWTTKLRRATTALRRLKRRIAWHERVLAKHGT